MPKMYKVKQQKQVILESKALQHNVLCAYLSNRPTFFLGGGGGMSLILTKSAFNWPKYSKILNNYVIYYYFK